MSLLGLLENAGVFAEGTNSQLKLAAKNGYLVAPSPVNGFWKGAPSTSYVDPTNVFMFFDDFLQLAVDDTTGIPTAYYGQADTGGVFALTTTLGGEITVASDDDANDGISMQLGSAVAPFHITKDSGYKLWAEFKVKATSHANIAGAFVGLAAAGYDWDILTDTTGVLANNKNLIGFNILAADATAWKASYKTGTQTVGAQAACTNADDYHIFGIKFDGANEVSFWVDGEKLTTTVAADATAFPAGGTFSPFICIKTGTTAAKTLAVDWIKVIQTR